MDDQDTEQTTGHPREDDRNELVDDSPIPDPGEGEQTAEDVPGAD
jgi:hypothetical protein